MSAENDTEDDTTVTSMEFDNDNDSVMFFSILIKLVVKLFILGVI